MYIVHVKKSKIGGWFWRLEHDNKKILATSEQYSSKKKAQNTAINVATAIGKDCLYKVENEEISI